MSGYCSVLRLGTYIQRTKEISKPNSVEKTTYEPSRQYADQIRFDSGPPIESKVSRKRTLAAKEKALQQIEESEGEASNITLGYMRTLAREYSAVC
ncbi:hypothetical protein HYALB_00005751 [Hymenoscyphus albidus]|uniref:Uncharacterized protein n=1 Tax=Hymenoscyphus albidus TaxID=595503 RepID=A0A9N9LQ24_9HELO|nr:hypothetical protein HYALB_00005751 [Hymenoscyphus albidus]